jgi:hypothetical protein
MLSKQPKKKTNRSIGAVHRSISEMHFLDSADDFICRQIKARNWSSIMLTVALTLHNRQHKPHTNKPLKTGKADQDHLSSAVHGYDSKLSSLSQSSVHFCYPKPTFCVCTTVSPLCPSHWFKGVCFDCISCRNRNTCFCRSRRLFNVHASTRSTVGYFLKLKFRPSSARIV